MAINAIEVEAFEVVVPVAAIEVIDPLVVESEEDPIIATTPEIAAIEVVTEQVMTPVSTPVFEVEKAPTEEDFVFNEINPSLDEIEVVDHEVIDTDTDQQIQFEFELPLQKEGVSEQIETPLA